LVREIIKPTNEYVNIKIPKEYIVKEVEVILFSLNSFEKSKKNRVNITERLFGALKGKDIKEDEYREFLEQKYL